LTEKAQKAESEEAQRQLLPSLEAEIRLAKRVRRCNRLPKLLKSRIREPHLAPKLNLICPFFELLFAKLKTNFNVAQALHFIKQALHIVKYDCLKGNLFSAKPPPIKSLDVRAKQQLSYHVALFP
jgi:hypothetical protein